jgi:hypothetical protein
MLQGLNIPVKLKLMVICELKKMFQVDKKNLKKYLRNAYFMVT